ncbi:ionotropic receptor 21a-like isoform X2 [Panulirus ornatus]|uniref:ionotropic receptor 21a-like isoform X2 n=1 Tax=Panulirus ornatus TaxID=150431 RepID=UPI003A883465
MIDDTVSSVVLVLVLLWLKTPVADGASHSNTRAFKGHHSSPGLPSLPTTTHHHDENRHSTTSSELIASPGEDSGWRITSLQRGFEPFPAIALSPATIKRKTIYHNTRRNMERLSPYSRIPPLTPQSAVAAAAVSGGRMPRLLTSAVNGSGGEDFLLEEEEEEGEWLGQLVSRLVRQELQECHLLLALDQGYYRSPVMHHLRHLPNVRQVLVVRTPQDLAGVVLWGGRLCSAYIFLLRDPSPLLTLASQHDPSWDYYGRYVVAGVSKEQLEALMMTKKGKKTQHIVGLVKSGAVGVWQVYINQLYSGQLVRPVTTWRRTSFTRPPHIFPDKISDLGGAILNVVTFEFAPAIMYEHRADGGLLRRYGRDVEVVRALADVFNFTINFVETPKGEVWGERLANGSWNGMVGLLGRGEGDLGIANLFVTSLTGRTQFQEFSAPFDHSVSCCLVRVSPPLPRWHAPSWPFRGQTWLTILVGLLLTGPVLYCLARPQVTRGRDIPDLQSISTSCLYAVSVHLKEPRTQEPVRASGRVMVAFLWVYVMVLTAAYSSNLTAFLTVTRQPNAIDTFRDLHDSQLSVVGLGPYYKNIMAHSENLFIRELSKRFIVLDSGVTERVLDGSGVYINSGKHIEYLADQLTPPGGAPIVRVMKECTWPFGVAVAYQSRSPLKPQMDRVIDKIFESGLVAYWFQDSLRLSKQISNRQVNVETRGLKYVGVDAADDSVDSTMVVPLGIIHMQGIFFILGVCYLSSVVLFAAEMYSSGRCYSG